MLTLPEYIGNESSIVRDDNPFWLHVSWNGLIDQNLELRRNEPLRALSENRIGRSIVNYVKQG